MESPLNGPRFYEAPDKGAGAGGKPKTGPEDLHPTEDAFANRLYFRAGESLSSELIASAEDPYELFTGVRELEEMLEDPNIPAGLSERYTPPRMLSLMYERAKVLREPVLDLDSHGIIVNYNKESGVGFPIKRKFLPYAVSVDEEKLVTNPITGKREYGECNFGTPEKRPILAESYNVAVKELEVRDVIGDNLNLRLNLDARDSLEELTAALHGGRISKFKVDHLETLFNLPSLEELQNKPLEVASTGVQPPEIKAPEITKEEIEAIRNFKDETGKKLTEKEINKRIEDLSKEKLRAKHEMGDQIEESIFCNLIMLKSGSKQQMLELLARPGTNELIRRMIQRETGKKDVSQVTDDEVENWRVKYIGRVNDWRDKEENIQSGWIEDTDRTLTTYTEGKETRGLLTQWSNIASYEGGKELSFSAANETRFIEDYVGGAVGSKEASWIGAAFLRATGVYASEGYVALPPGKDKNGKDIPQKDKVSLKLGEGRFISSDDTGKFLALMFNLKEGLKGRKSGLKDMIGRVPDMAMNLFDWAQVEVEVPKRDSKGNIIKKEDGTDEMETVRRSVWDAWLGTAAGRKTNLLTGKLTDEPVYREEYHRLGDIKFDTLERDFNGTFSIMQWLMGNREGPTGVFIDAMKTSFRYEDFLLDELKAKWKYIGIVMNPIVLTKGSKHLYQYEIDPKSGKPSDTYTAYILQRNYFRNLMSARIHSNSFAQGILGGTVKIPNPGLTPAYHEASMAKLIEMNIDAVLNDLPEDQEDVYKRYIDAYGDLSKAGTTLEINNILKKATVTDKVGRVTGKFH